MTDMINKTYAKYSNRSIKYNSSNTAFGDEPTIASCGKHAA